MSILSTKMRMIINHYVDDCPIFLPVFGYPAQPNQLSIQFHDKTILAPLQFKNLTSEADGANLQ